jgi:hypothetical protein
LVVSGDERIEEVFFVIGETIQLVGAVLKGKQGVGRIEGNIRFHDGHTLLFSHSSSDLDALGNKLRSTCEQIAEFHDAEIFTYKPDGKDVPQHWFYPLESTRNSMN